MTAAGRARGLGVDGRDMVAGADHCGEDRRGEGGRAHKDEVERRFCRGAHRSKLGGDGNSAALCLGELAQDHPALDHGEMVDKQDAVEVLDLVL